MPQFDFYSFISQTFYILLFFGPFYFFVVFSILTKYSAVIKFRKILDSSYINKCCLGKPDKFYSNYIRVFFLCANPVAEAALLDVPETEKTWILVVGILILFFSTFVLPISNLIIAWIFDYLFPKPSEIKEPSLPQQNTNPEPDPDNKDHPEATLLPEIPTTDIVVDFLVAILDKIIFLLEVFQRLALFGIVVLLGAADALSDLKDSLINIPETTQIWIIAGGILFIVSILPISKLIISWVFGYLFPKPSEIKDSVVDKVDVLGALLHEIFISSVIFVGLSLFAFLVLSI